MALPAGGRFPVSRSLHGALVLLGAVVAVLDGVERKHPPSRVQAVQIYYCGAPTRGP